MPFLLKYSSRALAFASVASFVVGALVWKGAVLGKTDPNDFQIEPAIQALGELAPSRVVPVTLTATNRSSRPVRVVGIRTTCERWICVYRATGLPCVVPPRATVKFGFEVVPKGGNSAADAAFNSEVTIYSDCPEKNISAVRISGTVRPEDAEK